MLTYGRDCCAACEAAGDPHRDECRPHPVYHHLDEGLVAQIRAACQEPMWDFALRREGADQDCEMRTNLDSVTAEIPRMGSTIAGVTSPSSRTKETASTPRSPASRPSENVAMLTPWRPRTVPI